MPAGGRDEVSAILEAVEHGDDDAEQRLLDLVYNDGQCTVTRASKSTKRPPIRLSCHRPEPEIV